MLDDNQVEKKLLERTPPPYCYLLSFNAADIRDSGVFVYEETKAGLRVGLLFKRKRDFEWQICLLEFGLDRKLAFEVMFFLEFIRAKVKRVYPFDGWIVNLKSLVKAKSELLRLPLKERGIKGASVRPVEKQDQP